MGRLLGKFMAPSWTRETPSGSINGTNAAFTLSSAPASAGSLSVAQNGLTLIPTTDYTLSGTTLTLVTPPVAGTNLTVQYLKFN